MRIRHQADLDPIDEIRTVIRCTECGYVAIATAEHIVQNPAGNDELIPFEIDVIETGAAEREQLQFADGRPFLDPNGEPAFRTLRPSHPVLISGAPDDVRACKLQ